jgi:hypothetical protein
VKTANSQRGHRNIKLILNRDAVRSNKDNTFESKPLLKANSTVRVPEFLKDRLSDKRTSSQVSGQQINTERIFSGQRTPNQGSLRRQPITTGHQSEVQFQPGNFKFRITDLLDYEKSQKRLEPLLSPANLEAKIVNLPV